MKYLKVFTDFSDDLNELSDIEVGRLFRAMLSYAENGTLPDLKGNERFLWAVAKSNIDAQRESYSNKVEGAAKARSLINSDIRSNQSDCNKNRLISAQDKDKEKDKDKEQKKNIKIYSPVPELNSAILSFIEFRKQIKKPMTDRAIELLISQLDKVSADTAEQIAILNQSVMNGWQSVYPLKNEQKSKPKNTTAAEYEPMTSSQEEKMRKFIEAAKNGVSHGV